MLLNDIVELLEMEEDVDNKNRKSIDVRTKHNRRINTILIILLVFILSCNFIEIFFSIKLHEVFLLKNPGENDTLYSLNSMVKKANSFYMIGVHIYCILFYFTGRGLKRYLIANGHIFIFYLFDIVLNLILQNESFSLVAISVEYICYGISINLYILMILIFRKIFLKPNPIVFEGGFDFVAPVEEVKDEKVFYIGF